MKIIKKFGARKATWLAFGLITLAAIGCSAQEQTNHKLGSNTGDVLDGTNAENAHMASPDTTGTQNILPGPTQQELDQAAEAARAYKQAISTLATLTAHPPLHTYDPSLVSGNINPKSMLSAFLPSLQGQGPIGSLYRIIVKLHHHTLRRLSNGLGREGIGIGSRKRDEEMRVKAIKVMDLLQHSADLGSADAVYTLAKISLFPPTEHFVSDPAKAFNSFYAHASRTGNASSQAYIAFFYATGYHGIVPVDQAKAQLYYTFAANGGDKNAQMALGYRYWSGIGTLEDCHRAVVWYEAASEQAMAKFLSGPPGGRTLPQTSTRLTDLVGGIYGPGASVASTGLNTQRPAIKAGHARAAGETWEDVLEYYLFNADRGETDFAYRLGKIFYQGSIYASAGGIASGSEGVGAVPRNFAHARHYFLLIARQIWPRDPPNLQHVPPKEDHGPVGYAAASAAYLGRMYLRGEGVKADPAVARLWFERGAEHGDRECNNALGIMWRDGLIPGKKADQKNALAYFTAAATQELAEAQVNMGKYHYMRGELQFATNYFETAMRHGSPFEAYYYLGEIHSAQAASAGLHPHVVTGSCSMAVSFHKLAAERGVWDDDLVREAEMSWMSGTDQGKETAILKWWIAAERGSEIAQNNLAYVLDQDKSILRLTRFSPMIPSNDTARLALTQWTRAAGQRNIDALVKVGDYYYHGLGVSADETEASRLEKAARYYQSAADTQLSALAMWNLGWMYENGVGVPQDFHLAKRHYDLALETNSEAYLPVTLSLGKLYLRSIWHTLMGGKDGLSIWGGDEEIQEHHKGAEEREIDGGSTEIAPDNGNSEDEHALPEEEDGLWYLGKARDEFHRRRGTHNPNERGREEDPIQWARDRRNAENERDSDFGPEDYFEGAMRGGNREDEEMGDTMETVLLVALCVFISILLYVRARIVDRMRRDQQQQQQDGDGHQPPAANGGVFPPPGDPARNEWAILR